MEIVDIATHPFDKVSGCSPCTNFQANQPTFKRKHTNLFDTNTTNDDEVRLAGLTERVVNVTFTSTLKMFTSTLSSTDLEGVNT